MRPGILAGGIVLLIIGIVIFAISWGVQPTFNNYDEQCTSFLGKLGQAFDPNLQQKCAEVNVLTSGTLAGMILGGVLGIIGLVILIIGAVSNATKSTDQKRRVLTFCRYCGKARSEISQTGEFCSFCGKSYRSLSASMKRCASCDSLTGDDSIFCANCGQQFTQAPPDNISIINARPISEKEKSTHDTGKIREDFRLVYAKGSQRKNTIGIILVVLVGGIISAFLLYPMLIGALYGTRLTFQVIGIDPNEDMTLIAQHQSQHWSWPAKAPSVLKQYPQNSTLLLGADSKSRSYR